MLGCLIVVAMLLSACASPAAISETEEISVWIIENDDEGIPQATKGPTVEYLNLGELLGGGDGLLAVISSTGVIPLELLTWRKPPYHL